MSDGFFPGFYTWILVYTDILWNRSLPNLLRSTLKQAILYSPIPANPLQFILPPSPVLDGEALMRAAEGISAAVVASGKAWFPLILRHALVAWY